MPRARRWSKKLASAFSALGVSPGELKKFLGHELSSCSPSELADLRKVYASIKEGEASWAEHLRLRTANEAEASEQPKTRSQAAKDAVKAHAKPKQAEATVDPMDPEPTFEPGANDQP